jgi:cytoskeletal protein RodZ
MNNLGEILREARKAKGISIRDAADATKIRSDFIANMEEGLFDYDLPEIYKRGFLRLYADFLDLDESQIIADYNAMVSTGRSERDNGKGSNAKSQFLSRLAAESEDSGTRPVEHELPNSDFSNAPANPLDGGDDNRLPTPYLKVGAILGAVVLLILVVLFAVSAMSGSGDKPAARDANPEFTVTITALRDTVFTLTNANDETKVLFSGEIRANTSKPFVTREPLYLQPRDRKDLKVERNGVQIDIANRPAVRYRLLPPDTQR